MATQDKMLSARLVVDVVDVNGEPLKAAKVEFRGDNSKGAAARFAREGHSYVAEIRTPLRGEVRVTSEGYEEQARDVGLTSGENRELFVLGPRGSRYYFREKVRMPVEAPRNLFALTLSQRARRDASKVNELLRSLKIKPQRASELAERSGTFLFEVPVTNARAMLARLSEHPAIEHVGAVVSLREGGNFSHLTQDVIVRFNGPRLRDVQRIAESLGFSVTREIVYAPHSYVLRWQKPATLEILDAIERLAKRPDVEWAEPSLVVTPELDAITPTDFLWAGLWDRQLIGLPDAWQNLQDAGLEPFGDPNILLAVWDSGTQTAAGIPTNADFTGNLSNGQPKVLAAFDFINMVANNDSPWSDHGSGVAGVSAAMANNPSPVAGQTYGLVGSAPNVQVMLCAGTASTDLYVADQYIWMAGFDPQSPVAGFPATPPLRGADVITCSLTPGAGAALSGIARAALDFVTTFGRGGKGTMCFFSTGNANQNNVIARPYGAYEKCFGIAAISYANDGVTEVRAPYSGWGQIAFCSPSQDQSPTVHNPPTGFMPWAASHAGLGNLISFPQASTTISSASVAGANTLTFVTIVGFAVNDVIHVGPIGALGSEPARITAVDGATNQVTLASALLNAHAAGDLIQTGPANHKNNFGGTSSATPLCAGVAALVLSANPDLTYIEARQVMRDTAIKLDLANTDPTGQWLDASGNPSVTSGQPAVRSQWYGYGRVDAEAAVQAAIDYGMTRDLVIRDNLSDVGIVATSGAFWNSPDIWCRTTAPAMDPGALPASYGAAGPHQTPVRGQPNWIYARVHNNGTTASLDAWVRLSITHFPGLEFTYPESFQPTNGPGDPLPVPVTPGTYFIGEAKVAGVPPGGEQVVVIEWPAALIPPSTVASGTVTWHPCLLAEIAPHDGPAATGNHVWDDNNLAQKNITIVGPDSASDFEMAVIVGNEANRADLLYVDIFRGKLPPSVELYVDLMDPRLFRQLRSIHAPHDRPEPQVEDGDVMVRPSLRPSRLLERAGWRIGRKNGRNVLLLLPRPQVRIPIYAGAGRLVPIIVGASGGGRSPTGRYEIVIMQRQPNGEVSGSASILVDGRQLRTKKRKG
ncbi:S8 family serine peptidase [Sphingomonas lutea]|uniref:S8 family serine peptidase n=1 Tax=Sphingomonas lutea TaxID=1045317 RepID=A0A7G9SHX2_9SPHN|nr:S8 family serine peptidase [Sphingomonas lutea]QNN67447.1 S8 family serine peptidase [Sphingomonas lutea]